MKNSMEYKGYKAAIVFDPDDETFHGTVVNIDDTVHFEGRSVSELKRALKESVEYYIDFCRRRGEEPDKPYSGRFLVRLTPDQHRAVAQAAKLRGTSVNSFVAKAVEKAVETTGL